MSTPAKSLGNYTGYQYEVTWNGNTLGFVRDVDPSGLKLKEIEQRVGEFNDILVDVRLRGGVEGTIKMVLEEVITERLRQIMPWAGSTGSFPISPAAFEHSCYANAQPLVITPKGGVAANDAITFLKAYPMYTLPKNAGNALRLLQIEFRIFPVQTALTDPTSPTISYAYIGTPPA